MFWGWYVRQYSTSLKTMKLITFLRHTLTCVHSFPMKRWTYAWGLWN